MVTAVVGTVVSGVEGKASVIVLVAQVQVVWAA